MIKPAALCLALFLLASCNDEAPQESEGSADDTIALTALKPSFDCASETGKAAATICTSPDLARLDNEVQRLYALAESGTYETPERLEELAAMQRRWLDRRDRCGEGGDVQGCLFDRYAMRIHELRQGFADARSQDDKGLSHGPYALACEGADFGVSLTLFDAVPVAFVQWEGQAMTLRQDGGGADRSFRSVAGDDDGATLALSDNDRKAAFGLAGKAAMPCVVEAVE